MTLVPILLENVQFEIIPSSPEFIPIIEIEYA